MWRKRFFSLRLHNSSESPQLYYFKSDQDREPLGNTFFPLSTLIFQGIINLETVTKVAKSPVEQQNKKSFTFSLAKTVVSLSNSASSSYFTFEVTTITRTYYFAASSEPETVVTANFPV